MKKYILIFTTLLFFKTYSQSKSNIYFFINEKDTLIKKQIATKTNEYEGYRIIDEKRLVKKSKRSFRKKPENKVLKKGEIWISEGDDIEYDAFDEYSFSYNRKNDTIISKSYINNLKIIRDRRQFLDTIKHLDKFRINYIFIEPENCSEYIMRKVEISTFE
jgi:hypothetical protein|tara:strand:+ start:532 stop:1014 length:483 start_codon:yes stop_codon:yes gene_type:complete